VEPRILWDHVHVVAELLRPAHVQLLEYVSSKLAIGADETWWRLMRAKRERRAVVIR